MIHAGLDLSRKRLDYYLMDADGHRVATGSVPPTGNGLALLAGRVHGYGQPVRAAIEAMTGARLGRQSRGTLATRPLPGPWRTHGTTPLALIDGPTQQISTVDAALRQRGAEQPDVPLRGSAPGSGWILSYTIAAESGDIQRF